MGSSIGLSAKGTPVCFLVLLILVNSTSGQSRPGDIDTTFGSGGVSITRVGSIFTGYNGPSTMLLQPDGKILVCGQIDNYGGDGHFFLARLTSSGALDPTFGSQGMIISSPNDAYPGADMALQPDGRIVIVGHDGGQVSLQRYEQNGFIDHSFGDGGTATLEIEGGASSVALQRDGKIVVAAYQWDQPPRIIRLNSDGSPDEAFADGGILLSDPFDMRGLRSVLIQPDGKLLAIGGIPHQTCCATSGIAIMRYLPDGSRDGSFGSNGRVIRSNLAIEFPEDAVLQPDGKILVSSRGDNSSFPTAYGGRLTRFNINGSIDTGFTPGNVSLWGSAMPAGVPWKLAIQPDGKLVMAGIVNQTGTAQFALVRLTPNGSPDSGFGVNGTSFPYLVGGAADISIQRDGKIVAFGGESAYEQLYDFWATRIHGDPRFFISGRVTTPEGHGLRNVQVTITGTDGVSRTVTTSSFGTYRFENVASGPTYTLSVASKRYRFAPRIVQVSGDLSNIDLVGLE
jgi:uncharacterized delta-60 repeat protein